MLTTKLTRAIGGNTDLLTSQSFVFQGATQDSEQVILIVLLSASGEDVFTKLRNLGFQTENTFFSNEASISERLNQTMETLKEQTSSLTQTSILLAALKDEALYMLSVGDASVQLLRNQKTSQLIESRDTQIVSGSLQEQDRVLFLSPRFPSTKNPDFENLPEVQTEPEVLEQLVQTAPEQPGFEAEISPTPPPRSWDDYFIQRLLLSDQEVIEQEIENYLQQQEAPEPIAVVLLSTQGLEPDQITEQEPRAQRDSEIRVNVAPEPNTVIMDQNRLEDEPLYSYQPKDHNREDELKSTKFKIPKFSPKLKRALYQLVFPLSFRKLGVLLFILLAVIFGSALSFYQYQQRNQLKNQFTQAVEGVKSNLAQAASQKDTNLNGARESITSAQTNYQKALGLIKDAPELKDLALQIAEAQKTILKTTEITNWSPFLSLDLIKPGFSAKRMSFSVGKILLLDQSQKSLVMVDTKTKNNELLAGSTQLGNAQFASLNGSFSFIYSTDKGLLRVDTNNKKISTVATPDKEWGRIADLFSFSSNLYVLDGGNNQIWKYVPTENGYSDKQIYLKDNQNLDFANANQLFIDYSVWVIKEDANIYRFTAGSKDFYSIGGLDTPLTNVQAFYAPEEADQAYLLEPSNKRIVVTKKNGEYISQYTSEFLANATDLIYDEDQKILYILAEGKIQQTTLQ